MLCIRDVHSVHYVSTKRNDTQDATSLSLKVKTYLDLANGFLTFSVSHQELQRLNVSDCFNLATINSYRQTLFKMFKVNYYVYCC